MNEEEKEVAAAEIIPMEKPLPVVDTGELFTVTIPSGKVQEFFLNGEQVAGVIDRIKSLANADPASYLNGADELVSTKMGRAQIKALAYKVTRSKTLLDDLGKKSVAELKELPRVIDANRKTIREELDKLAQEIKEPIERYEARVQALQDKIDWIWNRPLNLSNATSAEVQEALTKINNLPTTADVWREFQAQAIKGIHESTVTLTQMLAAKKKTEADAAELERLRKETEERDRRDAEDARVRAAEEQARKEADEKAQRDREASESRERAARLAAENAQREKERAEQRAREAEARAKEQEDAVRAARDEQKRILQAEKQEAAMRTADKDHRRQINTEALEDLTFAAGEEIPSDGEYVYRVSKAIATAIIKGKIRHVAISY